MSKYTTEVRFICENASGLTESVGFNDVESVLDKSWSKIFSDFPIFDEEYRAELCKKILRHYYTREICCETVGRWKLFLDDKMRNIMPYYNQLYKSELLKIQPLVSVDRSVTHEGKGSDSKSTHRSGINTSQTNTTESGDKSTQRNSANSSQTNTTGSTDTWSYYSDTPQGGIEGIQNNEYLTNATHNTGTDSTDSTLSGSNNETETEKKSDTTQSKQDGSSDENEVEEGKRDESYVDRITGYEGNQSEMLLKFRETFLNIDMMIIDELKDLFFTLW